MGYLILLLFILDLSSSMQCLQCIQSNQVVNGPVAMGGQDASGRWACRPGGPDCDTKCVLPSTQTDQNRPFPSVGCVSPLEMPLLGATYVINGLVNERSFNHRIFLAKLRLS
jgi:hypothetical protein